MDQFFEFYNAHGIDFNDSWFLVAFILSSDEGLSVTDMAEKLGISRAAISQMYRAMERNGLLVVHMDDRDRRRKLLFLTEEGRAAVTALEPIWNAVGECTDNLVESTGQDVLKAISDIERGLEKRSLFERVNDHLKQPAE